MTACPTCGSELVPDITVDDVKPTAAARMLAELHEAGMSRRAIGRVLYVSETSVFNYTHGYTAVPPGVEAQLVELHSHLIAWETVA